MKYALSLISALLLTACSGAGDSTPRAAAMTPVAPSFDRGAMNDLLSSAVETGELVGVSALVFDEGREVYRGHFGMADRERGVPTSDDTVWRIYSMTKPVTSVLIMDLVEEGKIDLDDPVSKYIPELANMKVASLSPDGQPKFDPQAQPMTVEDLMLHRAGMGYGIFGEVNPVESAYMKAGLFEPTEDLSVKMKKLSQLPLLAQPGEGWYYSYSIDVLGRIVEVVTEQSLYEAMEARILGPLGMSETSFRAHPNQKARFASNYLLQEDGSYIVAEDGQNSPFLIDNKFQSGGGGLVSTLDDYAQFAEMMLNGGELDGRRILNEDTVKMMMSDQMDSDDRFMMDWLGEQAGSSFGYGGSVEVTASPEAQAERGKYPGQWGWGGAARTNFYIDPANDAYGIIMLQFFGGDNPSIHDRFQALALTETRDD